ncbi:MAG: tautomerase family protein [Pseudomonadota bacterium]
MPLYICNSKRGAVDAAAKEKIARDITDIHCEVTGAPEIFVHVVFFEESAQFPLGESTLAVRGTIRKGRSSEQKERIAGAVKESLMQHGRVAPEHTHAEIRETPASWVLEGGEIMPEPGEEAAWFAAQEERRRAAGLQ